MTKPEHDHNGHRLRMKERFLKEGNFDSFQPHNILEYLLFYTIPIRDTNETAHRLIKHFGSLSAVFDAPYNELTKVEGVGPHTATLIKAILPMSRAYSVDKEKTGMVLCTTDDYVAYLKNKYVGYKEEVLSIICMDNRCKVISFDIISEGMSDRTPVDSRKLMGILLRTGATCIVMAHNHPGGLAFPSDGDRAATKAVSIVCSSINVKVLDHIIITSDDCVSLKESKMCLDYFDKRRIYE